MKRKIIALSILVTLVAAPLGPIAMPAFAAGDHQAYQVGAYGANASQNVNKGLGSWIKVKVPQTIVTGVTCHVFWPGQEVGSGGRFRRVRPSRIRGMRTVDEQSCFLVYHL
jgi:hypothetical protein